MDYLTLLEVSSKIRDIQSKMYKTVSKKYSINYTALEIIVFLSNNPDKNTAKDICNLLNLKTSLVSFHIDKLVNDGFLTRDSIAGDRRRIGLKTTEKCISIAEYCNKVRKQIYEGLTVNCSDEELNTLFVLISKIKENTEKITI